MNEAESSHNAFALEVTQRVNAPAVKAGRIKALQIFEIVYIYINKRQPRLFGQIIARSNRAIHPRRYVKKRIDAP